MSFIDELKRNTKSSSQLEKEKEEAERNMYNMSLRNTHNRIKARCMELAKQGHREAKITIGAYSGIEWPASWVTTRDRAIKFSSDLAELLKADGFEDVKFRVKRLSGHRAAFNAIFKLNW